MVMIIIRRLKLLYTDKNSEKSLLRGIYAIHFILQRKAAYKSYVQENTL